MCVSRPKAPRLKPIPVEKPVQEEAKPLVSPEEINQDSTATTRNRTSRRSLRIDLNTGGSGTGLNVPQG